MWTDIDLANMLYRQLIFLELHLHKLKKNEKLKLALKSIHKTIDRMDEYIEVLEGEKHD